MGMSVTEKVIKGLHDARRYLEDKEWHDRGASPHIDSINDALALLKEQEAVAIVYCCTCEQDIRPVREMRKDNRLWF